ALLGALLRASLGRLTRALEAATSLPVEAFVVTSSAVPRSRGGIGFGIRRSLLGGFILLGRLFLSLSLLLGRGLLSRSLLGLGLLFGSLVLLLFGCLVLLFVCHQTLSSCSRSIPRSFATVSSRATSRRTSVIREVFSSSPVACWRRRANCSSRVE